MSSFALAGVISTMKIENARKFFKFKQFVVATFYFFTSRFWNEFVFEIFVCVFPDSLIIVFEDDLKFECFFESNKVAIQAKIWLIDVRTIRI